MSKKKNKEQEAVEIDINAFEEEQVSDEMAPKQKSGQEPEQEAAPADATEDCGESDVMDVIEKLNAENAQLKDQLLRAMAETENVRRRAEREKNDAGAYAVTGFARDMLTVLDNMRRALDAMPEAVAEDMQSFIEGVELTERELLKIFERHGISKVHPEPGEKFDHNIHQAMFEMESDEHPHGHIGQAVAPGYLIKDRLLRPAMVGTVKKK